MPAPKGGFPQDARLGSEVAGGQLRVLQRIGSGGFGVVYLVETVVGGLRRALKVLSSQWHGDTGVQERFVNEALVLEQINHPNVARCYAAGRLEDGSLYLLFELIEGQQLTELLCSGKDDKPFDPMRAARIAKQIAAGLRAAHDSGVLHRDLKPDNILVVDAGSRREQVKIVDFGIAKLTTEGMAFTQSIVGTPEFLAPEQCLPGTPLDARVDLWQLGAVLFTMLSGRPPYTAEHGGISAIMGQQQNHLEQGPSPCELREELRDYPALVEIVRRLLASDAECRPKSAAKVCRELARIEHRLAPQREGNGARSLLFALCATPSESGWLALHGYLASQKEDLGDLVDATNAALHGWPDELRRAPSSLWEASQNGPHLFWPVVRSLDLSARGLGDEDLRELASNPALATITSLDLSDNEIGNEGLCALAASPYLTDLHTLNLSNNRISSQGIEAFAVSAATASLHTLFLSQNGIGARGAEALGRSALSLRVLSLAGNELGASGATAIAEGASFSGLERLDLSDSNIGADGVAILSFSSNLSRLQHLDLSHNALGPSGTATLSLSEYLRNLKSLRIARNGLGRQGLQLLLGSAVLGDLKVLDFSGNALGASGAMLLAGSPFGRRLEALYIGNNDLGDAGIATLLGSAHLGGLRALSLAENGMSSAGAALLVDASPQLEQLDLSANPIGDPGSQAIAEALGRLRIHTLSVQGCRLSGDGIGRMLNAGGLRHLEVSRNDIGPEGAEVIAGSRGLSELESLQIAHAELGPEGVAALTALPNLQSLRTIDLSSNGLGDEGVTALVASSPRLPRLESLTLEDNDLGPNAAEALSASSLAVHLTKVRLAHNQLGDAGAEALAKARTWHSLRSIDLQGNALSLGGASAICSSDNMAMLERINLSHNALSNVVDLYSLGEDRIAVMEESFGGIAAMGADFAERFYEELFARYPGVKPLFANTSMHKQHRHLMSTLVLVMDHLRKPEALESTVKELGTRHHGYKVAPSHYYAVSNTLVDCMRAVLGEQWTEAMQEAWSEALDAVGKLMMSSPRPTKAERPNRAANPAFADTSLSQEIT